MLKAWKKFREICKREAEISKAQRRLVQMPIDYQAIQTIADTVSSGYYVEIKIKTKLGDEITITKSNKQDENKFKSFQERFVDYQNGITNK